MAEIIAFDGIRFRRSVKLAYPQNQHTRARFVHAFADLRQSVTRIARRERVPLRLVEDMIREELIESRLPAPALKRAA